MGPEAFWPVRIHRGVDFDVEVTDVDKVPEVPGGLLSISRLLSPPGRPENRNPGPSASILLKVRAQDGAGDSGEQRTQVSQWTWSTPWNYGCSSGTHGSGTPTQVEGAGVGVRSYGERPGNRERRRGGGPDRVV